METAGKYITFQISGSYFALPARRIREMMPMQSLGCWMGRTTSNVLGTLHSRGRDIPVLDLRTQLGLKARESCRVERLIIVKSHDGLEFAFTADKITDCIVVHPHDIREEAIVGHGRVRHILDPDALIDQEMLLANTFSSSSLSSP
jgi:chemotaxis signal transduction protein